MVREVKGEGMEEVCGENRKKEGKGMGWNKRIATVLKTR